jgi:outer membrane protein
MRRVTLSCIAALLFVPAAHGAEAITLSAAWQAAQAHDPAFAAARAGHEAGRAQAQQARALWLPNISALGSAGRGAMDSHTRGAAFAAPGFGSTTGVDFQTNINGGTATRWSIMAEQPLFDAARLASARGLSVGARMADEQYRAVQQALMLRTARGYFDVLDARAQLAALDSLRAAAERAGAAAQARYDAGDIPVTDLREAQAMADAIGVQQLDARDRLTLAQAAFADLTGLDAAKLATIEGDAGKDAAAAETLEAWTRRTLAASPELAMRRLAAEQAAAEVDRHGFLNSPRLSLVAQAGRESLRGDGDFGAANVTGRQASIALQASVPLYTGGLRSAQRHEAQALARKADAELDGAEQQVEQRTRSAWLALRTAAARVQAVDRLRASAESRLDATRTGVEAGGRTVQELLAAEGDALRAAAEFRHAQTTWLLAGLELAAAAGELGDEGLAQADRHLVLQ